MDSNKVEQKVSEELKFRKKSNKMTTMMALSFSFQFGLMIIIPLLVFALFGKWLANKYDNQAFYYFALLLAIITSAIWFYKKINNLYKEFIDHDKDKLDK